MRKSSQHAVKRYATALEFIPRTLAENALGGVESHEVLNSIEVFRILLLSLQTQIIEELLDADARCDTVVRLCPISPSIQCPPSCGTSTLFRLPPYHPSFACSYPVPFFLQLFFIPYSPQHPCTHRYHVALVLTAFVVDIAMICCTV
ncbi:hypothetical protein BDR03DRAFT_284329 [Suillus americanus]|nr:hypothetical protein BDR03DRAFT_284329 [Suillus americanus]